MDWSDLVQDRDQVAGCCLQGNEFSGSTRCMEFLD
jgi:hypothetical protein